MFFTLGDEVSHVSPFRKPFWKLSKLTVD